MPTELRSATARTNGAKSKGPKSAATREISSQNSLRHGFTARNTVLLQCEDPALYEHLRNEYIATYKPKGAAESDLVDEMVVARWRIQRLWTIETALIDSEMIRQAETEKTVGQAFSPAISSSTDPGIQLALAFRTLIDESRSIAVLSRYESRLHRIHDRAYRTLHQLQQDRKPPAQPDAKPDAQPNPAPEAPPPGAAKKNCESNPPSPPTPKFLNPLATVGQTPRSAADPPVGLSATPQLHSEPRRHGGNALRRPPR